MDIKMPYRQTNFKKSVIFSDVDGTLYDVSKTPMQETIDDIEFAIANNSDFNLCTGNPYYERMQDLCQRVHAHYIIASSGAHIYDVYANKTIYTNAISFKELKKIIEALKEIDCQLAFWTQDKYFLLKKESGWNEEIVDYHFISKENQRNIPKVYANESIDPLKIEIYADNYENVEFKLAKIYKAIKYIKTVEIIVTSTNIEIQNKNVNKASAIKWMLENVYQNDDITTNDIMTIGDSNNDLAMLKLANYSYAMANTSKDALNSAHYFTSSVEQNGLGEAIIDYLYRYKNVVKQYILHKIGGKNV